MRRTIVALLAAGTLAGCAGDPTGLTDSCLVTTDGAELCGDSAAAWCRANRTAGTLSNDPGTQQACRDVGGG